jgi:hypothetical protein
MEIRSRTFELNRRNKVVMQTLEMNIKSIIFDQPEGTTINGLPTGYLNESYPHILPPDAKPGQPPPIDVQKIIEAFHPKDGDAVACVYSGLPSDGISAVDGNPSNFLITNLEPISRNFINSLPPLPKGIITRTFLKCGEAPAFFDLEMEVRGLHFLVENRLNKLDIPTIPTELGLAHAEAQLLWLWNDLTKRSLLKGLTKLTMHNRMTDTSVSLYNQSVMEFVIRTLQQNFEKNEKEQENG